VRGIITAMTRTGPGGPPLPRRAVLAGAAALGATGLAACSPGRATPQPPPDPDVLLRLRVAAEVRSLLAAYAAVIATHPATGARLRPFAAETRAHDRALSGPPGALPTPSRRTASTGPSAASSPAPSPVPTTPATALAWLAGLERAAAVRRRRQLLRAGPDLARLLGSIGASEATHAALIGHPAGAA
jgi:hypothetical protein